MILEWPGLFCVESIKKNLLDSWCKASTLLARLRAIKTYDLLCSVRFCRIVATWRKAPLCFRVTLLDLLFHRWTCRRKRWSTSCLWRLVPFWLYQDHRRVNKKKLHPSGGVGEWGKWKRTTSKGQDQRQEEGIPSPSVQMRSGIEGTPLPFVFYSQGEPLKSPNLHSHMVKTLNTVNKRHSWEVFIFAFQTRDHGCAHKICGSKEPRFKNRL